MLRIYATTGATLTRVNTDDLTDPTGLDQAIWSISSIQRDEEQSSRSASVLVRRGAR